MIKFGKRKNLFYPLMLILFIGLRRIIEILMQSFYEIKEPCLLPGLIFLSKFIFGIIGYYIYIKGIQSTRLDKLIGTNIIHTKNQYSANDSTLKISILIFFASYFDFIGTLIRKFFNIKNLRTKSLENRIRGFQIIVSSLFCYFTIRIKLYKHNIFALIIISLCVITIFITEMIYIVVKEENSEGFQSYISFFSVSGRAFMDTIEKYLFEYDYFSPFKVMMLEGFINSIGTFIIFLFTKNMDDYEIKPKSNSHINYSSFILIILLLFYFLFSGLKNIYRVSTIKIYSPMTRALAELILDPIIILILLLQYNEEFFQDSIPWFFGINISCSIIMAFCSCVYNDVIILYFWGLEHDTYKEITDRSVHLENMEDDNDSSDENSDEEKVN